MSRFRDHPRADWLPFEEAVTRILARGEPLPPERIPLDEASGRALAQSVAAPLTLPPADNSAMDGFAVRAEDVRGASPNDPVALAVVGSSFPGTPWSGLLGAMQAVRIMTGGAVPIGADTVIRVEDTDGEVDAGRVNVLQDRDLGRHVRPRGEDMQQGEQLLEPGTTLESGQISLLSGIGLWQVAVHRRPRVALLTTGDELRPLEPGKAPWSHGSIPDTNTPTLARALEGAGAEPVHLGIARDNPESLHAALDHLMESGADALVTTGGASMGAADLVKDALDRFGFQLDFWRIQIRPGSPVSFGMLSGTGGRPIPVFGLPGNPVSAFVTFQLLVRPFVLRLAGHRNLFRPVLRAVMSDPLSGARDLAVFLRVSLESVNGRLSARSTGAQGSGLLNSLGRSDGLAVIPRGRSTLEIGDTADVILLGDGVRGVPRVTLDPDP
jgi:molybdopterin molybdotransferase